MFYVIKKANEVLGTFDGDLDPKFKQIQSAQGIEYIESPQLTGTDPSLIMLNPAGHPVANVDKKAEREARKQDREAKLAAIKNYQPQPDDPQSVKDLMAAMKEIL